MVVKQYIGHRYVPLLDDEWNQVKDYEGLTVVTYQGNSFTSKKRVPKGVDILNNEFWMASGNYNAQIEYYRQDVRQIQELIKGTGTKISQFELIGDETNDTPRFKRALEHATLNGNQIILDQDLLLKETVDITDNIQITGFNNAVIFIEVVNGTGLNVIGKNVNLSGFTLDGKRLTRVPLYIGNTVNVKVTGVTVLNANSETRSAYGIHVDKSEKVVIESGLIKNIFSKENGIVGDSMGAARGVYLTDVISCVVRLCTFDGIGGFEDGDAIHVQSTISDNSSVIEHNRFLNVTKRAVKLQGNNNIVRSNEMYSNFTDQFNCPLTGISDYGKNNQLLDNTIEFLRAQNGIRIANNSENALVEGNSISVDKAGTYHAERTGTSQATCIGIYDSVGTRVYKNEMKTKGRKIYSTSGSKGIDLKYNTFHEGILVYIDLDSFKDLNMADNTFKTDPLNPPYLLMQLKNIDGLFTANNIFYPATNYIRFFETVKNVVILPNIFIDNLATNRYRTTDVTTGLDSMQFVGDYRYGSITLPGGTTQITLNHSLGRIPKSVTITPSLILNGTFSAIVSATGTVIIRISQVQTGDTVLYWRVE